MVVTEMFFPSQFNKNIKCPKNNYLSIYIVLSKFSYPDKI